MQLSKMFTHYLTDGFSSLLANPASAEGAICFSVFWSSVWPVEGFWERGGLLLPSLYHVSYHAGHSFSQDELTHAPSKPILMSIQSPRWVNPLAGPVATRHPVPIFSAFTAKCCRLNGLFVCFAAQIQEKSGRWQLSALRPPAKTSFLYEWQKQVKVELFCGGFSYSCRLLWVTCYF